MPAKLREPDRLIKLGIATYIFALALIAAFTIAFHLLTDSIVHQQQNTASIVNLSGRQRMLSQRIAKLVLERAAHAGFRPDAQTQAVLSTSIDQMEVAHHQLMYGDPAAHVPSPASSAVRDVYVKAPWLLDQQMHDFLVHARTLAMRPAAAVSFADADVIAIQAAAQGPMLNALNAAVTANQETSEHAITTLRGVLTTLTLLMLVILMLEALFLYRPLFNRLAKAHVALIEAGRTDPLTGCLNRRAFTYEAHNAVSLAREQDTPLAVLMADIDRFKNINDRHGHQAGDRVINSVVGSLLMTIRPEDVLCRMGGEEFAIMLPGNSLTQAMDVAELLRKTIEMQSVALDGAGTATLNLTVSIGVAMLEPTDLSMFDVLGRADQALYRAKGAGRNRVEVETGAYRPTQIEHMNLMRISRR